MVENDRKWLDVHLFLKIYYHFWVIKTHIKSKIRIQRTFYAFFEKLDCEKVGPGWAKKNDTQMKPNNFFVICLLPLQFTHITLQHVTFLYIEGFFLHKKRKKVMAN